MLKKAQDIEARARKILISLSCGSQMYICLNKSAKGLWPSAQRCKLISLHQTVEVELYSGGVETFHLYQIKQK